MEIARGAIVGRVTVEKAILIEDIKHGRSASFTSPSVKAK